MEEKILIDVSIDANQINKSITAVKDARNSLEALKTVQKQLEEQGLKNTTAYIKNEVEIRKLNATVSENNKVLTASAQVQATANGSIAQLRASVAALTAQYNNLSEEERENSEVGKRLAAEIKNKNNLLVEQKEKLGQSTNFFGRFSASMGQAVSSNQNLAVAQNALNNVMKANPIILIVALLGQLFAALQKNEQVMDVIEPILAALNEGFNVLADIVIELAKPLKALFENPQQALKDFVDFIKNNLINRVTAFKVILEGIINLDFKKLGDGLIQATSGVENATDKIKNLANTTKEYAQRIAEAAAAAAQLAKDQQALDDELLVSNELAAKNRIEIEKLTKASQDKTASDQDRAAALLELQKIEDESFQAQVKNAREQQRILEAQAKSSTTSGDDLKKISEARIKVYDLEAEAVRRQEAAANRIKKLQEEINADREKELAKQRERVTKERNAVLDLEQFKLEVDVKRAKTVEERIDREVALEQFKAQRLLANDKLLESERALIAAQSEEAINGIRTKGVEDLEKQRKEIIEKAKEARDLEFESALKQHEQYVQSEINQEKQRYLDGSISREEYNKQLEDLELAGLIAQQEIKKQFGEEDLSLNQQIIDARIAQKEFQNEQEIALEEQKLAAISGILGSAADLFNKQSLAYRALASAQALITTYQSANEAYKSVVGIPVVGPALAAVAAGIAVAGGLRNVAKINSTEPPKVPKGEDGLMINVEGKSHAQGGEDVYIGGRKVANIEGRETMVVLNKNATPLLRSLSSINEMTGGISFLNDRTPKRVLADGGFVARNASAQVASTSQSALVGQLSEAVKNINVVTRITDIEKLQSSINTSKVTAELS